MISGKTIHYIQKVFMISRTENTNFFVVVVVVILGIMTKYLVNFVCLFCYCLWFFFLICWFHFILFLGGGGGGGAEGGLKNCCRPT